LRALLATDSATLRRVDRPAPPGQSTAGGDAAVFYERSTPRLIRVTFLGETGRTQERYYVLDSLSFVRVRAVTTYAKPITVEPDPVAASTASDTIWVCGGRALARTDSTPVQDAVTTVRQLLSAP
jgi:hypothetical protein